MTEEPKPALPRRLRAGDLPGDAVELARALIGKCLIHSMPDGPVGVRIVETEAYPVGDPAALSFKGKTRSNSSLFAGFGRAHVYLCYGVSWLTNIAADAGEGNGAGVLFRAGEPVWGVGEMLKRRHRPRLVELTNGPGKLSAALGIGPAYDGVDFFGSAPIWIGDSIRPTAEIAVSTRIGISKAVEEPLRFRELGNPFVSGLKHRNTPVVSREA